MQAIELMRRTGVEFNTMSTVNRLSEGRGREVYLFLKSIGSRFMQFMPVVEYTCRETPGSRPTSYRPTPREARWASGPCRPAPSATSCATSSTSGS